MRQSLIVPAAVAFLCAASFAGSAHAAEHRVSSPDGGVDVTVSDEGGLHYRVAIGGLDLIIGGTDRVETDSTVVVTDSPLGLEFKDGTKLGPSATIAKAATEEHDDTWVNPFGNRRNVRNHYRELRLTAEEPGESTRTFGVVIRAYDNGVALRYDLPESSGLGDFVLTNELTEFRFADDYRCWAGDASESAENAYPEKTLSRISSGRAGRPYRSVLPLLVETPVGFVAVAESDLLDWAGMAITGTGSSTVKVSLAERKDGNGLVVSSVPRLSPWRVLMIGRKAADLVDSDLIATLATPSRIADVGWIKPGVSAWDSWWTGVNEFDPRKNTGVNARGTTESHKQYIDLAAEMGWQYQLMDWYWYPNMQRRSVDFSKTVPEINVPEVMAYAKAKNVRPLIWAHSADVKTVGIEKALAYFAEQGFSGVKIDFLNSESQETVDYCEEVLATAAKHHLLVDFHGTYKPTGLARTYPNYITQEGVLGNEYYKLPGNRCTPLHTITLPFTRGLLGPMDFTPGGFLNRAPEDFRTTYPAQVVGTRARQLAMTVVYFSPLQVLCDSPKNYRGQPGVEFLRALPTVWDETVVLEGEVARSVVLARRSGDRWYLAAMNGDDALTLQAPLSFLGEGRWNLRSFADNTASSEYEAVVESSRTVHARDTVPLSLLPAGGFAAILSKE